MRFSNIFVTVGTTKFEKLVKTISSGSAADTLKKIGCKKLTIQFGRGEDFEVNEVTKQGIQVDKYRLKPNILEDIQSADLVISHAGAGSCMEILGAQKPCIVVVNDELMGNHQMELAEQLAKDEFLFYCTPDTLESTLESIDVTKLKPYQKGNTKEFLRHLDILMES